MKKIFIAMVLVFGAGSISAYNLPLTSKTPGAKKIDYDGSVYDSKVSIDTGGYLSTIAYNLYRNNSTNKEFHDSNGHLKWNAFKKEMEDYVECDQADCQPLWDWIKKEGTCRVGMFLARLGGILHDYVSIEKKYSVKDPKWGEVVFDKWGLGRMVKTGGYYEWKILPDFYKTIPEITFRYDKKNDRYEHEWKQNYNFFCIDKDTAKKFE